MWTPQVRTALVRERAPSVQTARLQSPRDAAKVLRQIIPWNVTEERFVALALDTQNRTVAACTITTGLLNSSLVHPRKVFAFAILAGAASLIVGHNHPSGDPDPSPEDLEVSWQLMEAGRIIGIPLRDSIIIGTGEHDTGRIVSLLERGLIRNPADTTGNGTGRRAAHRAEVAS